MIVCSDTIYLRHSSSGVSVCDGADQMDSGFDTSVTRNAKLLRRGHSLQFGLKLVRQSAGYQPADDISNCESSHTARRSMSIGGARAILVQRCHVAQTQSYSHRFRNMRLGVACTDKCKCITCLRIFE